MRHHLPTAAVAAAVTVAVGLLTDAGWPGFVIGAGLALALWIMLFLGPFEATQRGAAPWATYAGAAVLAVALGYAFFRLGNGNGAWWAPAFIMAGVIMARTSPGAGETDRSGATDDRG
ncbi:hypothetical protein GCU60_04825 [Blastococcus saxobsidens]|uniref:Uncharacterized protein n=1 Tax=Blastococcus saxobsidens TaxID=138336 RepID=A0A6L9VZJ0_9ACTN|nr:hypothetical protein [Blastococcus saxobsidens]NEK85088.1 hypothetical protein [Blastococcus saxobsidens]